MESRTTESDHRYGHSDSPAFFCIFHLILVNGRANIGIAFHKRLAESIC